MSNRYTSKHDYGRFKIVESVWLVDKRIDIGNEVGL